MRQTTGTRKSPGEKIVKDIKRATRKHYSSEEKIRIVLDGLRGEDSIAELCRREGIFQGIYYKWSKDFMEAGKKRLARDTARAATTDEVKDLRRDPPRAFEFIKLFMRFEYTMKAVGWVNARYRSGGRPTQPLGSARPQRLAMQRSLRCNRRFAPHSICPPTCALYRC